MFHVSTLGINGILHLGWTVDTLSAENKIGGLDRTPSVFLRPSVPGLGVNKRCGVATRLFFLVLQPIDPCVAGIFPTLNI